MDGYSRGRAAASTTANEFHVACGLSLMFKHLAVKAVRCLVLEFRVFFFLFFCHSATMMSQRYPTLLSALNILYPPCDANISYCLIFMIFCAHISRRAAFTGVKQSEVCVLLCSGDSHGGRLTTLTGRPGLREFPSQCT